MQFCCLRQVVVPDDLQFEVDYHDLKERLFHKYRQPVPEEFASVRGGSTEEGTEGGPAGFTPAPTITEADEANDTTSLRRALDKRLFLLIKARGGCIYPSAHLFLRSMSATGHIHVHPGTGMQRLRL